VFIPTVMVPAWLGGLGPCVGSAALSVDAAREPVGVTVAELALFFAIGVGGERDGRVSSPGAPPRRGGRPFA
jgi:hypothetical protein